MDPNRAYSPPRGAGPRWADQGPGEWKPKEAQSELKAISHNYSYNSRQDENNFLERFKEIQNEKLASFLKLVYSSPQSYAALAKAFPSGLTYLEYAGAIAHLLLALQQVNLRWTLDVKVGLENMSSAITQFGLDLPLSTKKAKLKTCSQLFQLCSNAAFLNEATLRPEDRPLKNQVLSVVLHLLQLLANKAGTSLKPSNQQTVLHLLSFAHSFKMQQAPDEAAQVFALVEAMYESKLLTTYHSAMLSIARRKLDLKVRDLSDPAQLAELKQALAPLLKSRKTMGLTDFIQLLGSFLDWLGHAAAGVERVPLHVPQELLLELFEQVQETTEACAPEDPALQEVHLALWRCLNFSVSDFSLTNALERWRAAGPEGFEEEALLQAKAQSICQSVEHFFKLCDLKAKHLVKASLFERILRCSSQLYEKAEAVVGILGHSELADLTPEAANAVLGYFRELLFERLRGAEAGLKARDLWIMSQALETMARHARKIHLRDAGFFGPLRGALQAFDAEVRAKACFQLAKSWKKLQLELLACVPDIASEDAKHALLLSTLQDRQSGCGVEDLVVGCLLGSLKSCALGHPRLQELVACLCGPAFFKSAGLEFDQTKFRVARKLVNFFVEKGALTPTFLKSDPLGQAVALVVDYYCYLSIRPGSQTAFSPESQDAAATQASNARIFGLALEAQLPLLALPQLAQWLGQHPPRADDPAAALLAAETVSGPSFQNADTSKPHVQHISDLLGLLAKLGSLSAADKQARLRLPAKVLAAFSQEKNFFSAFFEATALKKDWSILRSRVLLDVCLFLRLALQETQEPATVSSAVRWLVRFSETDTDSLSDCARSALKQGASHLVIRLLAAGKIADIPAPSKVLIATQLSTASTKLEEALLQIKRIVDLLSA